MAIKGKKKSQSRGSQGARRPAAAPRPTPGPRRKVSWWRTRDGMLIGGIFLLVAIGVVVWLVMSAQDRAQEQEAEQTALETYTDGLQPALESVTPTATEMGAVTSVPEGDDLDALAEDTDTWIADLQAGQALVQQAFAPESAQSVNDLLSESISLYIQSAQTFKLLPDAEGKLQDELFTRATDQRDSAGRVMSGAIGALDSLRAENDLPASGLSSAVNISQPLPSALPSVVPELSPSPGSTDTQDKEDTGGGNEDKGKDGKNDAGNG